MIHFQCACGAELQVLELYAGGQVRCYACGSSVSVPADAGADEAFRFQCPHCAARVVARRTSSGKKSQCPACEKVYVVPDPPAETTCSPTKESRRIEMTTDDLALRFGLPFPVGKLESASAAPPQPRFLHSPPPDETSQPDRSLAVPSLPKIDDPDATVIELSHDSPPLSMDNDPRPNGSRDSSSLPTAAAIPQMGAAAEPERVGELLVVTGDCSGQHISLAFRQYVVGTESDCDLQSHSPLLSRHHCVFKRDGYALRVRDLGSANGTFVNGQQIAGEAVLNDGDEVRIADLTLQVLLPPPEITPSITDFVIT